MNILGLKPGRLLAVVFIVIGYFGLNLFLVAVVSGTDPYCPEGWVYFDQKSTCYFLDFEVTPSSTRNDGCIKNAATYLAQHETLTTNLASIRDEKTNAFICELINKNSANHGGLLYQIGLLKPENSATDKYSWLPMFEPLSYSNWADGQPKDDVEFPFVRIRFPECKWEVSSDRDRQYKICELFGIDPCHPAVNKNNCKNNQKCVYVSPGQFTCEVKSDSERYGGNNSDTDTIISGNDQNITDLIKNNGGNDNNITDLIENNVGNDNNITDLIKNNVGNDNNITDLIENNGGNSTKSDNGGLQNKFIEASKHSATATGAATGAATGEKNEALSLETMIIIVLSVLLCGVVILGFIVRALMERSKQIQEEDQQGEQQKKEQEGKKEKEQEHMGDTQQIQGENQQGEQQNEEQEEDGEKEEEQEHMVEEE